MQTPVEKERCTGCWACANGCPAGCISMEPDEEGFLYPKIDAAACTDCGLCRRVCPAARSVPVEGDVPKAYALHALDRELLEGSASGGGSTGAAFPCPPSSGRGFTGLGAFRCPSSR